MSETTATMTVTSSVASVDAENQSFTLRCATYTMGDPQVLHTMLGRRTPQEPG